LIVFSQKYLLPYFVFAGLLWKIKKGALSRQNFQVTTPRIFEHRLVSEQNEEKRAAPLIKPYSHLDHALALTPSVKHGLFKTMPIRRLSTSNDSGSPKRYFYILKHPEKGDVTGDVGTFQDGDRFLLINTLANLKKAVIQEHKLSLTVDDLEVHDDEKVELLNDDKELVKLAKTLTVDKRLIVRVKGIRKMHVYEAFVT